MSKPESTCETRDPEDEREARENGLNDTLHEILTCHVPPSLVHHKLTRAARPRRSRGTACPIEGDAVRPQHGAGDVEAANAVVDRHPLASRGALPVWGYAQAAPPVTSTLAPPRDRDHARLFRGRWVGVRAEVSPVMQEEFEQHPFDEASRAHAGHLSEFLSRCPRLRRQQEKLVSARLRTTHKSRKKAR